MTALHDTSQADHRQFAVVCEMAGHGNGVVFQSMNKLSPSAGEVAIQVEVSAINSRDVMVVHGQIPDPDLEESFFGPFLGMECSGTVVSLGAGVTEFQVGDEVVAIAPRCLATHTVTAARFVIRKPARLGFEPAAALPIAMLTAHYALHDAGRLAAGERVLIHSAAGGVGLAGIQVARRAGAEIFATAGSPEERAFLKALGVQYVMGSRSLEFVDEVMASTNGEGVDVVLNSLTGDALQRSFGLLRPYGRFVELGSRDIYQNREVGLRLFRKSLAFFSVDIDLLLTQRPRVATAILRQVMHDIEAGALDPLPYRIIPPSHLNQAYREMADPEHIGKIVVSMRGAEVQPEPEGISEISFRTDGTYLITGGLGGVGLLVAEWMVERGARHLVLVGRSGAVSIEQQERVEALRNTAADVLVVAADVSDPAQISDALNEIATKTPVLRGIIHAAMVLDDDFMVRLSSERFRRVTGPKILGAWNLHVQTMHLPLDFFILFSSATTLFGNTGQASYAAANAFLDALAHYRRAKGLPAMSINWGGIDKVGAVARDDSVARHLTTRGIELLTAKQTTGLLERFIGLNPVQIGGVRIDRHKMRAQIPRVPRFEEIFRSDPSDAEMTTANTAAPAGDAIRQAILAAEPSARPAIFVTYLTDLAAEVFKLDRAKIDTKRPLSKFGMDSLMAMDIKLKVAKNIGVDLPILDLLQDSNISEIADKLASRIKQASEDSEHGYVAPR